MNYTMSNIKASHDFSFWYNLAPTPSLVNYIPSSAGCSFSAENEEEEEISSDEENLGDFTEVEPEDEDPESQKLRRAYRSSAGPWITHRFNLSKWKDPRVKRYSGKMFKKFELTELSEDFDGILNKAIIIRCLSRVDRSPEDNCYAYTKCVVNKLKLTNINLISNYKHLQYVDVSHNKLTTLTALASLPYLKILNASHNLLTAALDFDPPHFLTVVDLSYNRIYEIGDLSAFWSVTDLNLGHNKIKAIEGIDSLRYLTTLNLSSNQIETINNLEGLRLQFLYLQHNDIAVKGDEVKLESLKYLRFINLSHNQILSLKMLENVKSLVSLDAANNNITKLLDIYYLRNLLYLSKLNLVGNTVSNFSRYFEVCKTHIQKLTTLDGELLSSDYWREKISDQNYFDFDEEQKANIARLKLFALDQLNPPEIHDWMVPFDEIPLTVVVFVGVIGSGRLSLLKKFSVHNKNVVLGCVYTTRPRYVHDKSKTYIHIDEDKFREMLQNGEFLAYNQELGYYHGIVHEEFRKARNGVLMFCAHISLALIIRRKFIHTIFLLTVPSSREVYLQNLYDSIVADYHNDSIRLFLSEKLVKECQKVFLEKKEEKIEKEVRDIEKYLIDRVCETVDENEIMFKHILKTSQLVESKSREEQESRKAEFMWTSDKNERMSLSLNVMHPGKSYISDSGAQTTLDSIQSTTQMKKFVNFMFDHAVDVASDKKEFAESVSEYSDTSTLLTNKSEESDRLYESDTSSFIEPETGNYLSSAKESDGKENKEKPHPNVYYSCPIFPYENIQEYHYRYGHVLADDPRIKAVYDDLLVQRENLIELHLSMPGLFREMTFTDDADKSLKNLQNLMKDIFQWVRSLEPVENYYADDTNKIFKSVISSKVTLCMEELKKEESISEKQAAEFVTVKFPHPCSTGGECTDPQCPRW